MDQSLQMLYESEQTFWKDQCSVSESMLEHVVWLRLMLTDLALPNTASALLNFGRRLDGGAAQATAIGAGVGVGAPTSTRVGESGAKESSRPGAMTATDASARAGGVAAGAAADNMGGSSTVRTTESGGATSSFTAPGSSRPSVYDEGDVHLRLLETKLASYSIAYEQLLQMVCTLFSTNVSLHFTRTSTNP